MDLLNRGCTVFFRKIPFPTIWFWIILNVFRQTRSWKLIISQISIDVEHRKTLRQMESSDAGVFMLRKCLGDSPEIPNHFEQLCKDGLPFKYPAVLKVWWSFDLCFFLENFLNFIFLSLACSIFPLKIEILLRIIFRINWVSYNWVKQISQ